MPALHFDLVLGSLYGEFFFALVQVNWLVLRVMDKLLIENHKAITLETLVPETVRHIRSLDLSEVIHDFFTAQSFRLNFILIERSLFLTLSIGVVIANRIIDSILEQHKCALRWQA